MILVTMMRHQMSLHSIWRCVCPHTVSIHFIAQFLCLWWSTLLTLYWTKMIFTIHIYKVSIWALSTILLASCAIVLWVKFFTVIVVCSMSCSRSLRVQDVWAMHTHEYSQWSNNRCICTTLQYTHIFQLWQDEQSLREPAVAAPLSNIDKISVLVDNHRLQTYRELESG